MPTHDRPEGNPFFRMVYQPVDEGTDPPAPPPMRTLLRQMSEQFDEQVRPLIEPIRRTTDALAESSGAIGVRTILPDLREVLHQFQVLIDRIAQQQAYVLIFGPLKSGKSTFMNAICSAYVSEVTSLPAYPCIVKVRHGERPASTVSRYDGQAETFEDQRALYEAVEQAHRELNARIREVEAAGESFDPAMHMPEAIRTIDVELPTGALAESGAVLVDTPGLYSRMKFGYDRMTRDFRNAAACAIFIVKTDNLFLEQVFQEFNELLDLFSRVFLVVNLDSTKKDLGPGGELVPSLEHEDPQRIIDAFRTLTMSAPLKEAADAGRLRIYPVDLLGAASRRLRARRGEAPATDGDRPHGEAQFDVLLTDLTEYLNSNEYLREFLVDSLHRAAVLLGDLRHLVEHDSVHELTDRAASLRTERDAAVVRQEAMDRQLAADWSVRAQARRDPLLRRAQEHGREIHRSAAAALVEAIRGWFADGRSLAQLRTEAIEPLLAQSREQLAQRLRVELGEHPSRRTGGLDLSDEAMDDLRAAEVDLEAFAHAATTTIGAIAPVGPAVPSLTPQAVPVKRRLGDWLLFRKQAQIRQRLFGAESDPTRPISPEDKGKRLGEPARQAIESLVTARAEQLLAEELPRQLVDAYVAALAGTIREGLEQHAAQARTSVADVRGRLDEVERVLGALGALRTDVDRIGHRVDEIRERFEHPQPAAPVEDRPAADPPRETGEMEGDRQAIPLCEEPDAIALVEEPHPAEHGRDEEDDMRIL